jgi:lysophospholipase L1-like esterase
MNGDGFRDHDHEPRKPQGALRIAVLGDSFTEALQIPVEQAFWAVTERELAGCPERRARSVEVLNFGVSGYGTGQELLLLQDRVWAYQPDIVLLAFFSGNDISDNTFELGRMGAPYFVRTADGLGLDVSHIPPVGLRQAWFRALDYSRLLQLLEAGRQAYKRRGRTTVDEELSGRLYLDQPDELWEEAWQVTEALIERMHHEVSSRGARFLLVTLSNGEQVLPDPAARARVQERLGVSDLLYPERRLRRLADAEGFPALLLAPELQRYAQERKVYLHGFQANPGEGHWNAEGHRVAGGLIAPFLCGLLGPA